MYCNSHEDHTEGRCGGAALTVDVVWHVLVAVMVSTSGDALPMHFGSLGEAKPHTWILCMPHTPLHVWTCAWGGETPHLDPIHSVALVVPVSVTIVCLVYIDGA